MSKIEAHNGFWTGHLFYFGDPVPENPAVTFNKTAYYNLSIVSVGTIEGVGDIYQIKKDEKGLSILVKSNRIPQDYEWTYTVAIPAFRYELDPLDGISKQQLTAYPLTSIGFRKAETSDAVRSAPTSIITRAKRAPGVPDNGAAPTKHPGPTDSG